MGVMVDEARALASDLLDEVESKNHVMVQKWEATQERGRLVRRLVDEMRATPVATIAALVQQDKMRMLAGKAPIYLGEALRRGGGELVAVTFNLRVNAGIDFVYNQLSGTSVAIADSIGLSNNTNTPAATDTATSVAPWNAQQTTDAAGSGTTGEWTALGLTRKTATTNSHTAAATSYTLGATWTASGTATGTRMAALYGGTGKATWSAGGSGTLVLANTFTSTTLAINDQLTLTWTINI